MGQLTCPFGVSFMDGTILKYGERAIDVDDDTIEFVMSDESVDAVGDIITASGWDLSRFKSGNPVALYGHSQHSLPIGRWEKVRVEGKRLMGRLRLARAGTSEFVDAVRALVQQKMINACSVGFRPVKYEPLDEKDPYGPQRYLKQQLLECSLVAVPANPNAIALRALNQFPTEVRSLLLAASGNQQQQRPVVKNGQVAKTQPPSGVQKMSLAERIQELQDELIGLQDLQAPFNKKTDEGEDFTDEEEAEYQQNKAAIESVNVKLERLRDREKALGQASQQRQQQIVTTAGPASPGIIQLRSQAPRERPMELFVKMGVLAFLSHVQRKPVDVIRAERYAERADVEAVIKAVTNPAMTTVAGWAAELVETANADFLQSLQAISCYGELVARGIRFTFGRNGQLKIPRRNRPVRAPGDLRGSFIGEGNPIPVRRGSFGSITLLPHKFGVISTFTREIAAHSTPAIEALIREGIIEDSAVALDEALLDNVAADAIRPAGLLNGVTPVAGTAGGGTAAMQADLGLLLAPFITANAADRLALLINPANVFKLQWASTAVGVYPFRDQVNQGNLGGIPLIQSTNVGTKDLIMLRTADFASASDDTPEFDVSDVATLHEDDGGYPTTNELNPGTVLPIVDAAGTAAKPVRSLWQTASIGIRMLQDIDWAMRRAGMVSYVNNITW
jgi:HK97 family phage prohead protease/HK97 family phage major capsid protein